MSQRTCIPLPVVSRQRGSTLMVALVFLLAMTLIGVAAMQGTSQQESMASNLRQSNLAFQAAETALRMGEGVLQQAVLPTFGTAANPGLVKALAPTSDVGTYWLDTYCWIVRTGCTSAESLVYNGLQLQEVGQQPRYVIEELPAVPARRTAGDSAKFQALPDEQYYRVTARGTGSTDDAVAILQSTYKR